MKPQMERLERRPFANLNVAHSYFYEGKLLSVGPDIITPETCKELREVFQHHA